MFLPIATHPPGSWSRYRGIMVLCILLALSGRLLGAAPPDSLNTLQKLTINRLAEVRLGNYMYLLKGLASLSGSDESAVEAELFMENAVSGDDPIFHSPEDIVESNVDPTLRTDAMSRNRKVLEYLNDFRLMFRPEGDAPVEYAILMRSEPRIVNGIVSTSILYQMRFNGRFDPKPEVPYVTHSRVAEMIAEDLGGGNWRVSIARDGFHVVDPAKPFIQYSVERDLEAVDKGNLSPTPELLALRKEETAAKEKAQEEEARKKMEYDLLILEGDKALGDGDPESAIDLYSQAQELVPLSVLHVTRRKKAERAAYQKAKTEIDRALDSLSNDLARQIRDKKISSVAVVEFTTPEGAANSMGKYLSEQVANRLATKGGFDVRTAGRGGKAQAEIRGKALRTGAANERVSLTTTIMDTKRAKIDGSAQGEFPMPQGFTSTPPEDLAASGPTRSESEQGVPSAKASDRIDSKGHWSIGVTGGVILTQVTDNDTLTDAFTANHPGPRAGLELERVSAKGNSRFATGVRFSRFKCSTSDDDTLRVIDVGYLQLPLLYRLFTNETAVGRFGAQIGGLLDYAIDSKTQSAVPGQFIEVSNFNVHASPGLCYEARGSGSTHIVANASYDLMLPRLSGEKDIPESGPRLNGWSFAIGVMF